VATIAFVPAQGLQQAAQSVIGQNVGAGRGDRARRATWIGVGLAAGALAVVGAVQWRYPAPIASALVPGASAPGAALTVDYLRILAYGYPAIGVTYLVIGGFNAARRTRTSMALTLLQYWGVRLPIAAAGAFGLGWLGIDILGSGIGVHAVFWAVTLSNVAAAAGGALHYRGRSRAGMLDRAVAEAAAAADD
jgi:Na+-driven multidrug efflux pump